MVEGRHDRDAFSSVSMLPPPKSASPICCMIIYVMIIERELIEFSASGHQAWFVSMFWELCTRDLIWVWGVVPPGRVPVTEQALCMGAP